MDSLEIKKEFAMSYQELVGYLVGANNKSVLIYTVGVDICFDYNI